MLVEGVVYLLSLVFAVGNRGGRWQEAGGGTRDGHRDTDPFAASSSRGNRRPSPQRASLRHLAEYHEGTRGVQLSREYACTLAE